MKRVTQGNNVTFTVVNSSDQNSLSFQWQKNDINITNGTSNVLTITKVTKEDEGNYTCIVTALYGVSVKSVVAQLIVCKL